MENKLNLKYEDILRQVIEGDEIVNGELEKMSLEEYCDLAVYIKRSGRESELNKLNLAYANANYFKNQQ